MRRREYSTIVCMEDDRLTVEPSNCPQVGQHEPMPVGLVDRANWAEAKLRTHTQVQCPGCGRYEIWRRRSAQVQP